MLNQVILIDNKPLDAFHSGYKYKGGEGRDEKICMDA